MYCLQDISVINFCCVSEKIRMLLFIIFSLILFYKNQGNKHTMTTKLEIEELLPIDRWRYINQAKYVSISELFQVIN